MAGFMLRPFIHLDLSFVPHHRYGSVFILLHVYIQLCQHSLLNMLSFFPFDILLLCQKLGVFNGVWINICVFYSVPLVLLSIFISITGCFQYCSSVVEFEVRDCDASRGSFIVQDCFGYPVFFVFPHEVEFCSFKVCEEFCWDFAGHCIESVC